MSYLIDSDWEADWLAGRPPAVPLITNLSEENIAISLITFGEIYEGIYYGRDPREAEVGFKKFLRGVEVLPLNRPIMQDFARIRGGLRKSGQLIGDPDLLIAATALHHDLTPGYPQCQRLPAHPQFEALPRRHRLDLLSPRSRYAFSHMPVTP